MPDLFSDIPAPKPQPGHGNARYLADLALGTPDADMRRKYREGFYPDLHLPSLPGWRKLAGRS